MPPELAQLITAAGGLLTRADIARRYAISRTRVQDITEHPAFPAPITRVGVNGREALWTAEAVDAWRNRRH